MPTYIVGDAAQGTTIRLEVGERLEVRLSENPTSGFRWRVEEQDPGILELVSSVYTPDAPRRPGAGGERALTFEAKKPGVSPLRLRLRRPRGAEGAASGEFAMAVEVGSSPLRRGPGLAGDGS